MYYDQSRTAEDMTSRPAQKGGKERRAEPRSRVRYSGLLRSTASGVATVRVLDVGRSGVRVTVPFRLPIKDQVEVCVGNSAVCGVVRNCVCIGAFEFHIGVRIDDSKLDHLHVFRGEVGKKKKKPPPPKN